jgi:hypothetical protein
MISASFDSKLNFKLNTALYLSLMIFIILIFPFQEIFVSYNIVGGYTIQPKKGQEKGQDNGSVHA